VPKGLDYDVTILAGDIVAPGRMAARWLRDSARFGDKPIVQIAAMELVTGRGASRHSSGKALHS